MESPRALDVVTGGAGFIGGHLARALLEEGRRVRVVDDFSTGRRENVPPGAELLEGDAADLADRAVEGADTVYHLAAMVSVPRSVETPLESHRATARSTLALLDAAERAKARRLVFASSSAVYGDAPELPKREDQEPRPASPYAVAKRCGELYAEYWARHRRLETVSLRFFNVFGPRQDPESPYAAAIPVFARRLRAGLTVPIYGDGRQTRDFIFVADVVQGLIAAARRPGVSGRVYNLAGGRAVSILDLVGLLARIAGIAPRLEFRPPRPGDILHSWADVSRAARDLGFAPRTSVEEGLRITLDGFAAGAGPASALRVARGGGRRP
jgi:UDP-glucose 4-epimerase